MLSTDFANLSVADIQSRAGVARSTFYRHYPSLDALLEDVVEQATAALTPPAARREPAVILTDLVDHVEGHSRLARALFTGGRAAPLVERFTVRLTQQLREAMPPGDRDPDLDAAMLAHAAVSGITVWLRQPGADPSALKARLKAWA